MIQFTINVGALEDLMALDDSDGFTPLLQVKRMGNSLRFRFTGPDGEQLGPDLVAGPGEQLDVPLSWMVQS